MNSPNLETEYATFRSTARDSPFGVRIVFLITLTRRLYDDEWNDLEQKIRHIFITYLSSRIVINVELGPNDRRVAEAKLLRISREFARIYPWISRRTIKIQIL